MDPEPLILNPKRWQVDEALATKEFPEWREIRLPVFGPQPNHCKPQTLTIRETFNPTRRSWIFACVLPGQEQERETEMVGALCRS